jgi:hypothetical protein
VIDDTDPAIVSNDTLLRISKRWFPLRNRENELTFTYGNTIRSLAIPTTQVQPLGHPPMLDSSPFVFRDEQGVLRTVRLQDNGRGVIFLYYRTIDNQVVVALRNAGTIDYTTGAVRLKFRIEDFRGRYISIYGRTRRNDILVSQNRFLIIDPADIEINMIESQ